MDLFYAIELLFWGWLQALERTGALALFLQAQVTMSPFGEAMASESPLSLPTAFKVAWPSPIVRRGREAELETELVWGHERPNLVAFGWVGSLSPLPLTKTSSPAVLTPVPALMMFQSPAGPNLCQGKNLARQLLWGVTAEKAW